ncbi:MAG: NADH-quinone oxidoreductase subunit C [Deltaproteobacteria bacterium]|jgi:NADH-quinone oxidoreductase subunit C|nr:NADH-quinone oxidoreductase subunit C [Deltaproteobacteria bacterium]
MIPSPLKNAACLFLAKENHAKCGSDFLAAVDPKTLVDLARAFLDAGFHLEDVSGLTAGEGAVSVYHFSHFDEPCRCTVLAVAPKGVFPSIASVYQGAEWHERETRDFFGFTYEGNPNFIPLLLPENMAEIHPLIKEAGSRAPLAVLFSPEGRGREILAKAEGFTLLDEPVREAAKETATAPEGGDNA